jgi:hypothetical protein
MEDLEQVQHQDKVDQEELVVQTLEEVEEVDQKDVE